MTMQIRVIRDGQPHIHAAAELPDLLADPANLVWVDIPDVDEPAKRVLEVFGFHPAAIYECAHRQRMPKCYPYHAHVFVVLHSPEIGEHGHVHYIELDQFIAENFLVTVHGPLNPAVTPGVALADTDAIWHRVRDGRFQPRTALELSHAIVANMTKGMEDTLEEVTADVWALEQQVTLGEMGDPEQFLAQMFRTRHGLLAVENMMSSAVEIYGRVDRVSRWLTERDRELIEDNIDQMSRVSRLARVQREYLQGVIDFYRTQTDTKMTIAAERLTVIAVVTLPITAMASILGMNVIVNAGTEYPALGLALAVMLAMSTVLLRWAKKQGWW